MGVVSQRGEKNEKNVWKTIQKKKKWTQKKKSNKGVTLTISDANTIEFIYMYVHPWFLMNLYVNFCLV